MAKSKEHAIAQGVTLAPASKGAAPGQYFGFSLQQLRLCHHLLSAPDDSSVSLEHTDDVAVHYSGGMTLLEQCKSSSGNPVSNQSVDLWKTFANWAEWCLQHSIDPYQCVFRLYVTPAKTGALVKQMHAADGPKEAAAALKNAKKLANKLDPETGCAPELSRFLAAGDAICHAIIERFELLGDNEPRSSIRERLVATIAPDFLDHLCAGVIGLARASVDELIEKNLVPIISTSKFRKGWQAYLRKHHLGGLLLPKEPSPSDSQIAALADLRPVFVRQLQAIKARTDIITLAISGYLRAIADKVHWADEGIVTKDSFDELDQSLERRYVMARDEIEDTMGSLTGEEQGRHLYRLCINSKFSIEEHELLDYFVCGAYNCLANDLRLGWHPKYKDLLGD